MNPSKSLVSVYIPTRNRCKMLKDAIESVMNQSWEAIELIVVDDASDDGTKEYLQSLNGNGSIPLKIFHNDTPHGAATSRNLAISVADGEYITGLDDDDQWMPNRIERLIKSMRNDISGVCSDDLMDYGTRKIRWRKKKMITHQELLFYNRVGNQLLTKTEYLRTLGGFDESLSAAQDYDLWIRLTEKFGPILNIPEVLQMVNMRENRKSITMSGQKMAGYKACFEKHRNKMTPVQITYQEYRLKMATGDKPSWFELFRSVPAQLLLKEIKRKLFLHV